MEIKRSSETISCGGCGKSGKELNGDGDWRMCDQCGGVYCHECFINIKKSPDACTAHDPYGKWLLASAARDPLSFK